MDKNYSKAHAAIIVANIMYGLGYSCIKLLTTGFMGSYALNVARILVSLPLFWLLLAFKPAAPGIKKADIPRFLMCGLAGVTVNQLLFLKGVSLTSTIHASLLSLGTPIFITVASVWLLNERFTQKKLLGLIAGIGGAGILISHRIGGAVGGNVLVGDLLIIGNSISYALYLVWVKPLMKLYNPVHVVRWIFVFGGLFIIPFGWSDFVKTDFAAFDNIAWLALLAVTLGSTFIAYLGNIYGLKYLGPTITGNYIYTQPVFATIIAISLLGEPFGWYQVIASILVFIGVFLVSKK